MKREYLKILDIGHSGNSPDRAMIILETAVSQCSFENKTKVIKVITGHGSGKLRNAVRDWCKDQDGRFKDVIYGEDYDMFNKAAIDMRSDCDQPYDIDFGRKNAAVTYIWLR